MSDTTAATNAAAAAAGVARPSVLSLPIKEKAALYAAYIPLFADGGVFDRVYADGL